MSAMNKAKRVVKEIMKLDDQAMLELAQEMYQYDSAVAKRLGAALTKTVIKNKVFDDVSKNT